MYAIAQREERMTWQVCLLHMVAQVRSWSRRMGRYEDIDWVWAKFRFGEGERLYFLLGRRAVAQDADVAIGALEYVMRRIRPPKVECGGVANVEPRVGHCLYPFETMVLA